MIHELSILRVSSIIASQNDMLSWLMNEAKGYQRTVKDYTLRILAINFASIHTSSMVRCYPLLT